MCPKHRLVRCQVWFSCVYTQLGFVVVFDFHFGLQFTLSGIVGAPACGDVMKLQVKVEDGVIVDAKFKTFGCGSAIASSSVATEWIKGKTVEEAMDVTNKDKHLIYRYHLLNCIVVC